MKNFLLVLLFAVCAAPSVSAAVVYVGPISTAAALVQGSSAVTFTGGTNLNNNNSGFTLGYSFTVNSPSFATSLGYYDQSGDGLTDSHDVGLWNASGTLLGSVTVASVNSLTDQFRYVQLTSPILLLPGQTYTVGGTSGTHDNYIFSTTGTVFNPDVNYLGSRYALGSSLSFPGSTNNPNLPAEPGTFGGSFQVVAVPEPSTRALLGTSAASVGLIVLRRRRVCHRR